MLPKTLTGGTTYYNGGATSPTSAVGLHVEGKPSLVVSVSTLGVSTTGISVQALKYDTYGVTPTAMSVNRGETHALLSALEAIVKIQVDEALEDGERIVASVLPIGGNAIVGVNIISKAQNDSELDVK
jgi:hypothetical protein